MEVSVHVSHHVDHFVSLSWDLAPYVLAFHVFRNYGVSVENYFDLVFAGFFDSFFQSVSVFLTDAERRSVCRSAEVLGSDTVIHFHRKLGIGENGLRALYVCLICRVVYPPFFVLVYVDQHELAGNIDTFIIFGSSFVEIYDFYSLVVSLYRGLIAAEVYFLFFAFCVSERDVCTVEGPAVQIRFIDGHIFEADVFHCLFDVFSGLFFGRGACGSEAEGRIVTHFGDGFVHIVREVSIQYIQERLEIFGILDLVLAAACSQARECHCCRQRYTDKFLRQFHCNTSFHFRVNDSI